MSKSWSATLKLPKSTFPPRPLPTCRDQYIQRCADQYYEWQRQNRPSDDTFVLHDGPPYANGSLHVGHALNKILKDMIVRTKVQQGRRIEYIPGWDCHGLPIELKALENAKETKLTPLEIRKSARNLASNTVVKQMKTFRSFGIMGDWNQKWTTMDTAYEMRQLRLFQKMVKKGLIYLKFKPVYWSPSSQTALAEAELEYKDDHISHAAWIRFPITNDWKSVPEFASLRDKVKGELYAVIWTTTPWTLPANRAIAVHNDLKYCVIRDGADALLVAEDRLDTLGQVLAKADSTRPESQPNVVYGTFEGNQLGELKYTNRLRGKAAPAQPIIHADFVSANSGSGLVHMAPGHGFDDYEVCNTHGIPVAAPIDDMGRFTQDAFPDAPELLQGAPSVIEGGGRKVLDLLKPSGDVLLVEKHQHKYPYDWRTKKPVVIRATEQWFADVASIKEEALDSLTTVRFIPESGRKRLESFVKGRSEWCISRQRAWGVPIPALYDSTGAAVVDEQVVEHIISVIQERGTHAWWSDAADDPAWIPSSLRGSFRRGTDTMDVWFDSGSSWTMMSWRADVYLEGSDQHRGWFQSSLLTRIAAGTETGATSEKGAPFKQLITHGFTLDEEGKKMSKSIGNTIEPQQVMDGTLLPPMKRKGKAAKGQPAYDALGPDALRIWAASSDYTRDVVLSVPVLQSIHTALIKYRTTLKMLLGSMHESARTAPLTVTDQVALVQLQDTMDEVGKAFDNHEFYKGYNALNRWVNNDLSAFYLEALKDRLYCGDGGGVLEPIFNGFLRMLAPMTPLLVEEAWEHRPEWMKQDTSLIHPLQQLYIDPLIDTNRLNIDPLELRNDIPIIMAVHGAVKPALEQARSAGHVGSSLQSTVKIHVPETDGGNYKIILSVLGKHADELADLFVVSTVYINKAEDTNSSTHSADFSFREEFEVRGVKAYVEVRPPEHAKCPRCWRYVAPREDALCSRCEDAVQTT
ncbi:tRNA synthetases class I-domain-containing protein [Xylaria bambusicola]|uniref:tRNA synthetases class I-domain-containing protein n=1 Tax=Xylaria bambusicola TaxID=326684 RepID=UPI002007B32A|nr:tRNA synthetases class I-domain-containing protein [Xylaria bambusicola]KAI0513067.1 tRNA synthetases class I-domain-containing protein [Xylaria bambusicola]